jgi:hypothetical protein
MAIVTELSDKTGNVYDLAAKRFDVDKHIVLDGDITGEAYWNAESGMTLEADIKGNTIGSAELKNKAVTLDKLADDAKTYIDTAEADAVSSANAYTDEQIETINVAYIADAEYNTTKKEIVFTNAKGAEVASIDATAFIKDGMVDSVKFENGNLVISFNTDAGKEDINVPISHVFDPTNYYTKNEVDTKLNKKLDVSVASSTYATTTNLNTEINDRKAADTTIQNNIDDVNARIDALENTTVKNVKTKQTAVSTPEASGNTVSFIDTIAQNENGEISVTKKTVRTASTNASGLMSSADKAKLDGIASGADANVKADWNVTDSSSDAFILNKPDVKTKQTPNSISVSGSKVISSISQNENGELTMEKSEIALEAVYDATNHCLTFTNMTFVQ